jgi:hypothetical protein
MLAINSPRVIYIQISDRNRAEALLLLLRGGFSVTCLAGKVYGVHESHLGFLKRKRIPFKKINSQLRPRPGTAPQLS